MIRTQITDVSAPGTVIGGGLTLTHKPGQRIALYATTGGGVRPVGRFDRAVDAWKALDALDAGSAMPGPMWGTA